MFILILILHVIVCLVLIAVILLQAGRGGGLSDLAGASTQTQSIFGTQTNKFMTRATEVSAVLFILTSLTLGILSTQRGKSLMNRERLIHDLKTSLPVAATSEVPPAPVQPVETTPAPAPAN